MTRLLDLSFLIDLSGMRRFSLLKISLIICSHAIVSAQEIIESGEIKKQLDIASES